jgi:Ice-binding-like
MTTNASVSKNKIFSAWAPIIGIAVAVVFVRLEGRAAQAPVALGSANTFAVLAATTVTSTGATAIDGDLGVSPGNTVTGSPTMTGTLHLGDPAAAQAQSDLTTAYNDAAGRSVAAVTVAGNLGGQTLAPGLYTSATSLEISSGDLTLDASGDPNGIWIFQMGSTFVTTVGRQVILSGGAQAANIFWQVGSSATIGGSSVFKGTIMANQSITMNTSATLEGRALARNGAVALDANTIAIPTTGTTSVILVSAAVVSGAYTDAPGYSVNLATKSITVPMSGSLRYYRIKSATALTITSILLYGDDVVITYN